jgi:hypothetical protein
LKSEYLIAEVLWPAEKSAADTAKRMVPNIASEYTSLRIEIASLSPLKKVRRDGSRLHSRFVLNLNIQNSVGQEKQPFYVRHSW